MVHVSKVTFMEALDRYRVAGFKRAAAEAEYLVAYGRALAAATGKNEKIREGEADIATEELRLAREEARVRESAARFEIEYLLKLAAPPDRDEAAA